MSGVTHYADQDDVRLADTYVKGKLADDRYIGERNDLCIVERSFRGRRCVKRSP